MFLKNDSLIRSR